MRGISDDRVQREDRHPPRIAMFRCILTVLLLHTVYAQDDKTRAVQDVFGSANENLKWIPSGFEVLSTTPLPSLVALERCGEGSGKGKKVCVPYHRCDPTTETVIAEPIENVNTDGAGIIDIRAGVNDCESYLDVCCNLPDDGQIPTAAPVIVTPKPPVPPTPKPSYCGIRNPQGLDFTITGNLNGEAEYGEFPWVLAILQANFNPSVNRSLICGASLIAPQVALTGAHCVAKYQKNLGEIKIRAGEWDTLTEKERFPYQERKVSRIIVHEEFNDKTLANDYALLLLERAYSQAENIGTICLPPHGQVFNSRNCFTGGWGQKEFGSRGAYSNILKKIELPIVSHSQCEPLLKTTRLGTYFKLHESFVCAGDKGKDACTGDGGSPLVCPDPNNPRRYQQAGIVAWGIGCGNVPGVYADISKGRNWIDAKMTELGYNTQPYTE